MNRLRSLLLLGITSVGLVAPSRAEAEPDYDIVVYGGTSAGVIAAVQAAKMGKSVLLVGPDQHLGGLTSGGLGWTDTGDKSVIGGLAREFYHRIWQAYQEEETWRWQAPSEYGNRGQGTPAIDGANRTMWIFEPHVAESVFDSFVDDFDIPVWRDTWLDRDQGVTLTDSRIQSIPFLDGRRVSARMFIDATYEGDLMAAAGVDYHVGRESQDTYGEQWNGVQTGVLHHRHHFGVFDRGISPYIKADDPNSGLLPKISVAPPGEFGAGDKRIQAYCFRMCLSNHPDNRVPFAAPAGYDPSQYALLARVFDAGWREAFSKFDPIPNRKTDTNNHGPFSTDNIGANYEYPEGSYQRRREIIEEHERYQQGLMYFIANDPSVPQEVREKMSSWGLAKDEFVDNGHWPHQIYVREARRMIGDYVMTENELLKRRPTPEPVGMGSYTMDSHNVQRYVTPEGYVQNEGDIGVSTQGPYSIALGSLLPKEEQAENLLVPICVSSSHIAFGSIRMEPVFMILGQSAATVASMAIDADQTVQEVPYPQLRERLIEDGQILDTDSLPALRDLKKDYPGVLIDDTEAVKSGAWSRSGSIGGYIGLGYLHDGAEAGVDKSVRYEIQIPESGEYAIRMAYTPSGNRATNVPVSLRCNELSFQFSVNQQRLPNLDERFQRLGTLKAKKGDAVTITVTNKGADGHVIADAFWLAPIDREP